MNGSYTPTAKIGESIAIVSMGDTHVAIGAGQYVYIQKHSTLADGLYTANAAIAANETLTSSNVTAVPGGGLNSLNSNLLNTFAHSWEFIPDAGSGNGGFIDFHYNGSSADYTSRIIELISGILTVEAQLQCTNGFLLSDGGHIDPLKMVEVSDANQALQGLSMIQPSATNNPFSGESWATLITIIGTANYGTQIALPWFNTMEDSIAVRTKDNGTWQGWRYLGKRARIVEKRALTIPSGSNYVALSSHSGYRLTSVSISSDGYAATNPKVLTYMADENGGNDIIWVDTVPASNVTIYVWCTYDLIQ